MYQESPCRSQPDPQKQRQTLYEQSTHQGNYFFTCADKYVVWLVVNYNEQDEGVEDH